MNIAEIDKLYSELNVKALSMSGGMRKFGHERLVRTEKWKDMGGYLERKWGMVSERKLVVSVMELPLPMTREEIIAKFDERVEASGIGEKQVALHAEEKKRKRCGGHRSKKLVPLFLLFLNLSCWR